ncbi:hypothetical protein LJC58_06335 [Lachnospiraceae bacterium OttesenSCG-928-D06]|nr:hypothetical protein [Lachnospiraceae bacterium OttesenSCG-928-D06]
MVTGSFLTEDSYLEDITEPPTLNRYVYCVASPLNYWDPSGHWIRLSEIKEIGRFINDDANVAHVQKNGITLDRAVTFF